MAKKKDTHAPEPAARDPAKVEALTAAGIPDDQIAEALPLLGTGLSLTGLIALWQKWGHLVPQLWRLVQDVRALLGGGTLTPGEPPPPAPAAPGDPFAG